MTASFTPRVVLVTGGAGFIGSNLCRWLLESDPGVVVVNYDALTYAGNLESLADVETLHGADGDGRCHFVRGDIRDRARVSDALAGRVRDVGGGGGGSTRREIPAPDAVLHLAAESHVDRSILAAGDFVSTNV